MQMTRSGAGTDLPSKQEMQRAFAILKSQVKSNELIVVLTYILNRLESLEK